VREGPAPSNLLDDVRLKKLSNLGGLVGGNAALNQLQQQFQNVSVRRAPSTSYSGSQAMSFSRG
jgi:hypothetical protein